jgi:catechol 2,3-dioxygenase-like lactoylglutathione lyase family enzyme
MPVLELARVSITVADFGRAVGFYRDALGFVPGGETAIDDPAWARLMGIAEQVSARAADLRIGRQQVELITFDPPDEPYPPDGRSNDSWFQHIALVAGDITAAWERLQPHGATSISTHGPQLLPPNTGKVTAYKFRDPEGHPLELLSFPVGVGDAAWHNSSNPHVLGYDHSAIVVTDLERNHPRPRVKLPVDDCPLP